MAALFPPLYPERPDAPLLALGPSFAEEISRSVIQTIWRDELADPREFEIRTAAGLTMLEAFHPRDHLECMLAAQGVGFHCAIMETLRQAMQPTQSTAVAIKLRANASMMSRSFSNLLRDVERRQAKALPERPGEGPVAPPPAGDPPPDGGSGPKPRARRATVKTRVAASALGVATLVEPGPPPPDPHFSDEAEMPEDVETRPDGTPGNLSGYIPKPAAVEFVPREPPIMLALATRPKPWRMVNAVQNEPALPAEAAPVEDRPAGGRGPLDLRERIFTGDSLSRFASARFDPDAPVEKLVFEDEDSVVELELVSTGGDPEAEAERQAMIAAHPEGKPIVIFRHGTKTPDDPPDC